MSFLKFKFLNEYLKVTMSLDQFIQKENKQITYVFPLQDSDNAKRRVQVHKYKGKLLIDIRELYCKDDEWLPGRRGIALRLEDFKSLLEYLPLIKESVNALGGDLDEKLNDDDIEIVQLEE